MPQVNPQNYEWDDEKLSWGDFAAGDDNGDQLASGQIGEVAVAEVGDENGVNSQIASYSVVRLGAPLGATGRSAIGKLFAILDDSSGAQVSNNVQIRFVAQSKNKNRVKPITGWFKQRDLDQSDPSKRVELEPQTWDNNQPAYVTDGRVIAVQARNPSGSVTVDINGAVSELDLPILAGW